MSIPVQKCTDQELIDFADLIYLDITERELTPDDHEWLEWDAIYDELRTRGWTPDELSNLICCPEW